ncbi:MAG: M15 family metallopeptidase [Lachnospiraceae bacterium]|nr:M15 family metallopeptidase [Lachnospiraceae bacterium]
MKKKKKRRIKLFGLLVPVLAVVLFLSLCPQYRYVLAEKIGINCDEIKMTKVNPGDLSQFTLEELKADEKVTFNQSMMLINTEYLLQDDYVADLSCYNNTDLQMNCCIHDAYKELSSAVNSETGSKLYVSSAYRTYEEQLEQYEKDSDTATVAGASEHQTGLALDVYVAYNAGFNFLKTEAGHFVNSNCWEYGFIIRYPSYGKDKTGIKYEPWHIRYVGAPHAKIIYNNQLTLEEYILSLKDNVWYEIDGYLISRQMPGDNASLTLPNKYSSAIISPDNTGSYIITIKK